MRKKLLITVGAALTALLLTVSCSNDFIEQNNPGTQTEGPRTIAVSFGPQTRTALGEDGVTPKFTGKDEWIKVSNGKESKDCQVTVDDKGNASFTTDLTGTLTAVYPESAAKMNGDAIAGVNVSYVQDGTFANANICMAENITGNVAIFQNQTAVLCITPAAGDDTQYIEVSAEEYDISNYAPHGSTFTSHTVHVIVPETEKPIAYFVSILAPDGLTVGDLTFSDGVNEMTITGEKAATPIQAGTLCNVPAECWESPAPAADYVEIGGVKWATCNIGADTPTEKGWYFSWGNTEGYIYDNTNKYWVKASDKTTKLGTDGSFSTANYSISLDKNISPTSENDAARANWGGDWRMPTKDEFQALYDACVGKNGYDKTTKPLTGKPENKGVYWCDNYDGVAGCLFYNGTNVLFFPAASFGSNTNLSTNNGYYWSSTYNSSTFAYHLLFNNSEVEPQNFTMLRCYGFPIRPVYDPASGSTVDDLKVLTDDSDKWQK